MSMMITIENAIKEVIQQQSWNHCQQNNCDDAEEFSDCWFSKYVGCPK
jgi:hypothetical protein